MHMLDAMSMHAIYHINAYLHACIECNIDAYISCYIHKYIRCYVHADVICQDNACIGFHIKQMLQTYIYYIPY